MTKSTTRTITNHRSAITGRFVTPGTVKRHPMTTTTERNRVITPAPRKK